ncbi:hypothetical protein C8R44DRAFT_222918 [Mycena epipterygia]|nr:hypothetical protein C8R44DRAFT_222918 [Mycena epipterygia]
MNSEPKPIPEGLRTLRQKESYIFKKFPPGPPAHWKAPCPSGPFSWIEWTLFKGLCVAGHGRVELTPLWASIKLEQVGDESVWVQGIRGMCDRLNNMLIVASLLLATSAVFITTSPPNPRMVNYTLRGPYICMLGSFGLLVGAIVVAGAAYLVCARARPSWTERVMYGTRFHVYCIMLSYPFVAIGVGTLLLAFGVLSAVWCAEDSGIQGAAPILLFLPILMGVLFGVSCAKATMNSTSTPQVSPSFPVPVGDHVPLLTAFTYSPHPTRT